MLIAALNSKLEVERAAYYSGAPIVTDAEYDADEAQLQGLVKAHPEQAHLATVLTTVGSDMPLFAEVPDVTGARTTPVQQAKQRSNGRVAHLVPMLSIENFYTIDDVCAWAESLGWPTLSVGSKLDGVSDSLVYADGDLRLALTRGDGAAGESVLSQIRVAEGVPSSISTNAPFDGRVEIRGEVVIAQSSMKALNAELEAIGQDPYVSTRGLAAGTLKLSDLDEVRHRQLLLRPWDVILPHGALPDSGVERLKAIVSLGFAPSDDRIVTNREDLREAIEEMLVTLQEPDADIVMDGIVIKVDSHRLREELGRGSKFTKYQVCFKPQNQKAETVIREVKWQVGRGGSITPVAVFDPVTLGGARIARSTIHNFNVLSALGIRIGSRVALIRSGDVIPKITEVLEQPEGSVEMMAPTHCPDCSSSLSGSSWDELDAADLFCDSDICPGRVRDLLPYIADRTVLEIDGLGPELAGKLVAAGIVKSLSTALSDLFQFQAETKSLIASVGPDKTSAALLSKGLPVALTLSMVESLEDAKIAPWSVWIAAMAIPMIGRRLGKVLATQLQLQPDDLPALPAKFAAIQLSSIDGLGVSKLGELHSYAADPAWIQLCSALHELGVRPAALVSATNNGPKPLEGVSFVLTGEFDSIGTRDQIAARLEARGAVSKSGVSKNVTHLIVGAAPGKSKVTKAESLGIRQVGVDWLIDALAGE